MDNNINIIELDERLEAILSAIQILSSSREMKKTHTNRVEQLALDYITNRILTKLDKDKMDVINIQKQMMYNLADDINNNLDEYIESLGSTKELKSYIGYFILNEYLTKNVEVEVKEESVSIQDNPNDEVDAKEELEDKQIKDSEAKSGEETVDVIEIDNDMEDEDIDNNIDEEEECDLELSTPSSKKTKTDLLISDGPLDDNFSNAYSDDINVVTEFLKSFFTYLINSPISSEAETVYDYIKEIYQYYYLDIKESFSDVKTRRELLEAYEHFNNYSAINFLTNRHKKELKKAFRLFIFYLLKVNGENFSKHADFEIKIYNEIE